MDLCKLLRILTKNYSFITQKRKDFPSLIHAVISALRIIDVISYFCEHISFILFCFKVLFLNP